MYMPKSNGSATQFHPDFVKRLMRYVRRKCGAQADPDDILQETFSRVLTRMADGGLSAEEHEPYAFRVASNLIIDGHRRNRREFVDLPEALSSDSSGLERITEAKRELSATMEVIDAMPKLRRQVFIMARVEGHSHVEISQSHGRKPQSNRKAHVTRAGRSCEGAAEVAGRIRTNRGDPRSWIMRRIKRTMV